MRTTTRVALAGAATVVWAGVLIGARNAAAPTIWVVNDGGGPGVHFTDIPPAVAAATDGDVILVRPGVYSDFSVSERLTIVGTTGARLTKGTAGITVHAAHGQVTVAHLQARWLEVLDCPGTVVLERLTITGVSPAPSAPLGSPYGGTVYVRGSADVRIHRTNVTGYGEPWSGGYGHVGIRIASSRVEVVDSTVVAAHGRDGDHCNEQIAGFGGEGVCIEKGSRVHLALTDSTSGDGGDLLNNTIGCGIGYGGHGGHGVETEWSGGQPSDLIVTGTDANVLDAGDAGKLEIFSLGYCGWPGDGIHASGGSLRWSSITRVRGQGCGAIEGQTISTSGTTVVHPLQHDPSLERTGPTTTSFKNPGQTTLTLHGFPGAQATLLLGREPIVLDDSTAAVELLVNPVGIFPLGTVPASGKLDYDLPLGPAWPKSLMDGTPVFFAQAELVYPAGDVRRTNSIPVVLRN